MSIRLHQAKGKKKDPHYPERCAAADTLRLCVGKLDSLLFRSSASSDAFDYLIGRDWRRGRGRSPIKVLQARSKAPLPSCGEELAAAWEHRLDGLSSAELQAAREVEEYRIFRCNPDALAALPWRRDRGILAHWLHDQLMAQLPVGLRRDVLCSLRRSQPSPPPDLRNPRAALPPRAASAMPRSDLPALPWLQPRRSRGHGARLRRNEARACDERVCERRLAHLAATSALSPNAPPFQPPMQPALPPPDAPPPPRAALPPVPSLPPPRDWFYIDLEQRVQGPFPESQISEWSLRGLFPPDLQMRSSEDQPGVYVVLSELVSAGGGDSPFVEAHPTASTPSAPPRAASSRRTPVSYTHLTLPTNREV